jgi:hypothetical protein
MTEQLLDAYQKLRAWVRDFGSEKNPEFIDTLNVVLDFVYENRNTNTRCCPKCNGLILTIDDPICMCGNTLSAVSCANLADAITVAMITPPTNAELGLAAEITAANEVTATPNPTPSVPVERQD